MISPHKLRPLLAVLAGRLMMLSGCERTSSRPLVGENPFRNIPGIQQDERELSPQTDNRVTGIDSHRRLSGEGMEPTRATNWLNKIQHPTTPRKKRSVGLGYPSHEGRKNCIRSSADRCVRQYKMPLPESKSIAVPLSRARCGSPS